LKLATHEEGPSSPPLLEPDLLPNPPSPAPCPQNNVNITCVTILEATYAARKRYLYGRESSLEGDSSDDEEEENTEGGGLHEFLAWPPELLHMPEKKRASRKRRKEVVGAATLDAEEEGAAAWLGDDEQEGCDARGRGDRRSSSLKLRSLSAWRATSTGGGAAMGARRAVMGGGGGGLERDWVGTGGG
jgi:hypothetical protein